MTVKGKHFESIQDIESAMQNSATKNIPERGLPGLLHKVEKTKGSAQKEQEYLEGN